MSRLAMLRWIVIALVAAIAAVAAAWYLIAPHYRPGLREGEVYGIDVSHHQGEIDWTAVADDGIEFAYIKATEGGDWVDPRFEENWDAATDAGLRVGAYHFFRTCTDGALQAQNVLDTIPAESDLPIAIDLEGHGICGGVEPDADETRSNLRTLMAEVEAERGDSIFYVLEGFESLEDLFGDPTEWRRSILNRPGDDDWTVWQVSSFADIDSIDARVDLNVGALEQFEQS